MSELSGVVDWVRTEAAFETADGVCVEGRLFPMVDVVVHEDVAPGACAGGVAGSPWLNVDVPYTPIGYGNSAHPSKSSERS